MPKEATTRLVLGLMTFGPDPSKGGRINSRADFLSCLSTFAGAGYRELDTARVYCGGEQESWTASALAELSKPTEKELASGSDAGTNGPVPNFSLATKWYPQGAGDHAPHVLRERLETSLKALEVDSVDIFYLHAPDRATPFIETLKEANEMYKEGKFKQLGLSNFAAHEVAEVCTLAREHGLLRPSVYQGKYNALHRALERELIPTCRHFGLSVLAYNPLAGGLLTGKYSSAQAVPQDGGRFSDTAGGFGRMYRARYFKDANFEALDMLSRTLQTGNESLSMVDVALRWLVHHSALDFEQGDGIVLGVSSHDQLTGNLKAIKNGPLPEEILEVLDRAAKVAITEEGPYWHGELKYGYRLE